MRILALDIGGANTKRLLYEGVVKASEIHHFPFWERRDEFENFLSGLKSKADRVAVTMTAELCDVFPDKEGGVRFVVSCCEKIFESPYYLSVEGRLLKAGDIEDFKDLAAANWLASTYFLEKEFGEGILLDIGSTTTDIVPFGKGQRIYWKTDLERLRRDQLLYTGLLRTPLSAIVKKVPLGGELVNISSEYFAITADIYNILDRDMEYTCETPDGAGKRREDSMRRVARLLCADLGEVGEGDITKICEYIHKKQVEDIGEGLQKVAERAGLSDIYICGIGKDLGIEACRQRGLDFIDLSRVTEAYDNLPCLGLALMCSGGEGI